MKDALGFKVAATFFSVCSDLKKQTDLGTDLFPPSSVSTTVILTILLRVRAICVFPCHRHWNFFHWKVDIRIFKARNDLYACCETGTDWESGQELHRKNWKSVFHQTASRSRTLATNSKHWFTTSFLQPLSYLVTPKGPENCQLTSRFLLVLKQ